MSNFKSNRNDRIESAGNSQTKSTHSGQIIISEEDGELAEKRKDDEAMDEALPMDSSSQASSSTPFIGTAKEVGVVFVPPEQGVKTAEVKREKSEESSDDEPAGLVICFHK